MGTGHQKTIIADPLLANTPPRDLSGIIYLKPNSLSISVRNIPENLFAGLFEYRQDGGNLYNDASALSSLLSAVKSNIPGITEFSSRKVVVESRFYTLVPKQFFNKENAADFLRFNFKFPAGYSIFWNNIQKKEIINVFGIPNKLAGFMNSILNFPEILHPGTVLAESMLIRYLRENKDGQIFINIRENELDICLIKDDNLLYLNTFEYRSTEDFIYFVLFALESLEQNPETVKVALLGKISNSDPLYSISRKFIRNIDILTRYDRFSYSSQFDPAKAARDYLLQNAELCE